MTQAQRRDIRKALEKLQAYLDPILADWREMDDAQRDKMLGPGTVLGDARAYFAQFMRRSLPQPERPAADPEADAKFARKVAAIQNVVKTLAEPEALA